MSSYYGDILQEIYRRLFRHFGPQHWWPAESPFEVCVGAILTQNTNWRNVERAIENLKARNLLSPQALYELPEDLLAELIRPAGYFRVKARRLGEFVRWLVERYGGNLSALEEVDTGELRRELLTLRGIGPETADSILLYALGRPVFVVDAYTRRILLRHGLVTEEADYHEIQELFMENLPADPDLFNEYHALLVACGKHLCRSRRPRCGDCPLQEMGSDPIF
ncbi:endonuclease III domain-containing protein [Thermosulfurimonas sp. F29]|uniref:endonuclease III domain-containing protein n=1 Tax=Thermosulfurimonas sp. F29 TaxID=2867247 RepID=UPI001C82C60B|nr:endonuclease III domain-containing protein [Thermosulfurimonas sp. F29]MBX6423771.1 endonuclease III domain-containing protein [Thermosulfurimonas sp. F29]